ncbi:MULTISPECIES: AAA family ATPase [unclassified Janthinobacterium]|uniref:AAA family ATPase n=1 Tax=unclassified Janthinobacterium TaxID=2610881 RepID=UPI001E659785|nr:MULTISPECIES: AAA family ATPase [unclassified Janthinobacterium]MCC7641971.1 AAA family ATPase [Janthinobacterium sp. EB271-G4-3-1]MCC7690097.1 AAA family ATPase [Janthinobacterium sp. EB271-G4-3-2]
MKDIATPATQPIEKDEFETWLGERPKWLQTAARQIIDHKRHLNPEEIAALAQLCQSEATGEKDAIFFTVEPGTLAHAAVRSPLRICGITEVQGVSAIKNGAEIDFGPHNLAVIYGPNGSGKTAFSRLIKQACGSKAKDEIYPNIYEEATPPSSARLRISLADVVTEINWTLAAGPVSPLRSMHVFDSRTASMYINEKNEATYEPSQMRFISSLIKVCDGVAECLNVGKAKLVKKLPLIPVDLAETISAKWLAKLSAKTIGDNVEKACTYTAEQGAERLTLETTLAQKDVAGRLVAIGRERTALTQLNQHLSAIKEKLSDATVGQLVEARVSAITKRKAAKEDAQRVFADAEVDGIGNATWRQLWELARKFSIEYAYPGIPFPNTSEEAKCVLCNQELDGAAQARLKHFEEFVQGGLEASAKQAEGQVDVLVKRLPVLPQIEEWRVQLAVLKLTEESCSQLHASLLARKSFAESATEVKDLPVLDWAQSDQVIAKLLGELLIEEKGLQALQQDDQRKQMVARVFELRAAEWLKQNKQSISDEVARLNTVAAMDKAISQANTIALTKKSNELAKSELSAGYQKRFAAELKRLGGDRLKVIPESKQQGKGKTTFGIALTETKRDAPAAKILSEGELRIVALAAFLADITGANQVTPFVFDDPISSLDQDFEERVVKRLVGLTEERQVVIFTHRLSLLAQVDAEVKKIKEAADFAKTSSPVKLHVETLRRMGNVAGIRVSFSARDSKPKQAINSFQNDYVPKLKKLLTNGDEQYEQYAKGVCSDLRIVVEKCIESELLNDVITRFRRPINTVGKLGALAKIEKGDCDLMDDLMTRYSIFEHSQSEEFPAPVPDAAQIEIDVNNLAKWIEEFSKRAVPQ